MRLLRLAKIILVGLSFGLDQIVFAGNRAGAVGKLLGHLLAWRDLSAPRGVRLRRALESLGPIFVKFGQMLSTRRDLMPVDIADELALLQDRVPPFASSLARAELERVYRKPVEEVFARFEAEPLASASVAQVHFGTLPDGREIAVKILRPGIAPVIEHDIALLDASAWLLERLWSEGRRLKPREVVAEFDKHLHDELDLMREAANCAQLHRNFANSPLLRVPEVYWDWCSETVMVMERMHGVPISRTDELIEHRIDIPALARAGVEIFFTQVFRDGFFHADMHPGNIFVGTAGNDKGKYIALDFGIVGTLTDIDKNYLARNFLAFFHRDYKRVAEVHVESGWVPADTRIDEFESAIRAVCEPIFDKPLKDISFGRVLLRLFQTSRRFNVEIQPQLVLLQKTLLNIEGLGRQLDPDLDLWQTARPYLERWMSEQVGWRALIRNIKREAPHWSALLPALPGLARKALEAVEQMPALIARLDAIQAERRRTNRLLTGAILLMALTAGLLAALHF